MTRPEDFQPKPEITIMKLTQEQMTTNTPIPLGRLKELHRPVTQLASQCCKLCGGQWPCTVGDLMDKAERFARRIVADYDDGPDYEAAKGFLDGA